MVSAIDCGVQPPSLCATRRGRERDQKNFILAHGEDLPRNVLGKVACQEDTDRGDLGGRHGVLDPLHPRLLLGGVDRNGADQSRPRKWRHAIRAHLEARHIERDRLRKPNDAEFGGGVVGLAEVADEPRRGGKVDEGALLLLLKVGCGRLRHIKCTVKMHLDHRVPIDGAHAVEDTVTQDAGVVHHTVDAAEVIDGRLDNALGSLRLGDAVAVGHRHAAGLADLVGDGLCHAEVAAIAVGRAAEVVDNNLASLGSREHGNLAANAATRARNHNDFALNALARHSTSPHVVAALRSWLQTHRDVGFDRSLTRARPCRRRVDRDPLFFGRDKRA